MKSCGTPSCEPTAPAGYEGEWRASSKYRMMVHDARERRGCCIDCGKRLALPLPLPARHLVEGLDGEKIDVTTVGMVPRFDPEAHEFECDCQVCQSDMLGIVPCLRLA